MQAQERIISPDVSPEEHSEVTMRPERLDDFIGQGQLKKNLQIFIDAAKGRQEALDHVLFYGPPGLGKTTLSQIISKELNVGFRATSGPILSKAGELVAILTNLQKNDVLFIDEIHRLSPTVEEILYPAMEDYAVDIIIGDGPAARTVKINLPKFTLVGATTRLGLLTNPLRDRFGIPLKLNFYTHEELQQVIERGARLMDCVIDSAASAELARCARGTPRIAMRLLRRIRDFTTHKNENTISRDTVLESLASLGVDSLGLDAMDHTYLKYIADNYRGGPVGIETIAAGLSEDRDTIEDTIEPYLMQIGFIARTPRGRVLTMNCLKHLSYPLGNVSPEITGLLES